MQFLTKLDKKFLLIRKNIILYKLTLEKKVYIKQT